MKLKNQNIVVSGGAGFIGSTLAQSLCANNSVTIIDNLLHGNKLDSAPNLRLARENICNTQKARPFLKNADLVFYLASIVGANETQKKPFETFRNEIHGIQTVISAAMDFGIQKIVYASSSAVYGKQNSSVAVDEQSPLFPASSYALAKLAGEQLLKNAFEQNRVPTASARLFNAYGPKQDNRGVIPRFFEQSRKNQALTIFGNGKQTRDFVFVSDICQGLTALAENKRTKGECFNLATGKETSINALAQKIIEMTYSRSRIIHKPFKERKELETLHSVGNPDKLFRKTGFKPQTELRTGLQKTLESMQTQKKRLNY